MNYASMIEERKLKQGFIIATLISTIVGTFTTGIGLFDRLNDKRKQHHRDRGQDERVRELEKRVAENEKHRNESKSRKTDERGYGGGYDRKDNIDGERLRDSLDYGGAVVRREYDAGFDRLGRRFGEGDLLAQTQLQSQIITLQSTVITLLEQALITGQPPDLTRLRNASEFAREGSVRALRDQYQRLLQAAPLQRPMGMVRRISSTPDMRMGSGGGSAASLVGRGRSPPRKALTFNRSGPLFCRLAEDLQRSDRPLGRRVLENGCPDCGALVRMDDDDGRPWLVVKEVVKDRVSRPVDEGMEVVEYVEERRYEVTERFLMKCHREGRGFACWLCYRSREEDTLCKGVDGLVRHLGEEHGVKEMEREVDLRDVTVYR